MNIVYKLENIVRNKIYIGRGDEKNRKSNHFSSLKKNSHHSFVMKEDYYFDGKESFEFVAIACPIKPELIEELEDILIQQYDAMNPSLGYNRRCKNHASLAASFEYTERRSWRTYTLLPGVKFADPVPEILYSKFQNSLYTKLAIKKLFR